VVSLVIWPEKSADLILDRVSDHTDGLSGDKDSLTGTADSIRKTLCVLSHGITKNETDLSGELTELRKMIAEFNATELPEGPDRINLLMGQILRKKIKVQGFTLQRR
jgi:hypothetical protein